MSGRTAFTLRVQTGCDEPCTYCIIPSTRGHARSTPVDQILAEVRRIEAAGYKEVTLTGVHLGAYGRDLNSGVDLGALLRSVIAGTERIVIRLGSLEPMDCTPEIMDLAAGTDRLAPAFHLPLQHASDRVLSMMARPYTRASYDAIVTALRDRMPDAAMTADVIVGFPGETDDDVDALVAYLRGSPLTSLHVFPYSDRPGTPASGMPDKVPGTAVRTRARAVRDVGEHLSRAFRLGQIGRIRRALTIEHGAAVVTDNGLRLPLRAPGPPNEHVCVRVGEKDAELVDGPGEA
jgi:threonylcarbamoyladenosine tRNA methylthiotransferase MtaB